jgi:superfamily II DNA or RNA helicase
VEAKLTFLAGTLELRGLDTASELLPSSFVWDDRSASFRAPANAYADLVRALVRAKIPYADEAKQYTELVENARVHRVPRPYQTAALDAWLKARASGVVVLPTGAGKSHLGVMAIEAKKRSTLVIAPTLDIVRQWYDTLRTSFAMQVGIIGGGSYEILPLTVSTYDSAYLHMQNLGSRFGLVIFDECHHLPGASYALAAKLCIAPFRLGLSATPERADGKDKELEQLIGPTVYRLDVTDLRGEYLAEYDVEEIIVELSPEERAEYEEERSIYREFVQDHGIRMGSPTGWNEFVIRSSSTVEGRRAMAGYRRQRELALNPKAKLDCVDSLLHEHRNDRAILFTQDNAMAYRIARRFLIPVITHQTKVKERSALLEGLSKGTYSAIVTSKVLNEGVDVPAARVAIVISGSASVREHVQRLGRVLRKQADKRAVLYELVSGGTGETYISQRRREHVAYG